MAFLEDGKDGVQGPQGVPGPAGADGQTLYTWIKYADDASGNGMSQYPDGKSYIGLAYNKTTNIESSVASDYTWSLIKGSDGKDGINGVDGVDGIDGVGIVSVSEQYYLSPSKVQPTGGEWLDYVPVWTVGMYMWTRTKVVYTEGEPTYTNPYCDTTWELAQDLSVYEGTLPPAETPLAGKLWLDMSVSPPIFRRWKGEDYETTNMDGWETVNDTAYIDEAVKNAVTKEDFTYVIRVATDGLHVGAEGSTGEVLIDSDSVDVLIGGKTFTSLGANYVEFGNYQVRRTADGGLAFKMR